MHLSSLKRQDIKGPVDVLGDTFKSEHCRETSVPWIQPNPTSPPVSAGAPEQTPLWCLLAELVNRSVCLRDALQNSVTLIPRLTCWRHITLRNCCHGNLSLSRTHQEMLQVLENSMPLVSVSFFWVSQSVASTKRTFKPMTEGFEHKCLQRTRLHCTGHGGEGCGFAGIAWDYI